MTHTLCLSVLQVQSIERQARAASPLECSGVLLGSTSGGLTVVAQVLQLINTDRRPDRFSIADTEIRRARQVAAESKLDVVAILHSHPHSAAAPSPRDREALKYSKYPWIIVGFGPNGDLDIKAFAAGPGELIPVQLDGAPLTSLSPVLCT